MRKIYFLYALTLFSCNNVLNINNTKIDRVILDSVMVYLDTSKINPYIYDNDVVIDSQLSKEYLIYSAHNEPKGTKFHIFEIEDTSIMYLRSINFNNVLTQISIHPDHYILDAEFISLNNINLLIYPLNIIVNVDSLGKIKNKYQFKELDYGLYTNNVTAKLISNSEYLSCNLQSLEWNYCADKSIHEKKFSTYSMVVLDKIENKFIITLNYPVIYNNKFFDDVTPSTSHAANNKFLYSFSRDHNIYLFDPTNNVYDTIFAPSNLFTTNDLIEFDRTKCVNYKYIEKYAVENSRYFSIYYDKYREVYYRICIEGVKQGSNGVYLEGENPWSINVLDKNFQSRGELYFNTKEYDYTSILITSKGLAIMPYKYFEKNKDKIKYDIFKI